MAIIDGMKLKIAELYKEINELDKEGNTEENCIEILRLKKQIQELQVAIQHRKNQIGLKSA